MWVRGSGCEVSGARAAQAFGSVGASMEAVSKPEIRRGKDAGPVGAVFEPHEIGAQPAARLRPESPRKPF